MAKTAERFSPAVYLALLKRCEITTIAHLENALNQDLDVNELAMLCRHFQTNAGGVVKAVAGELGLP